MQDISQSAVGRGFQKLAEISALIGGLGLLTVTLLVVVSIIGRMFIFAGLAPIPGDTELVEAITAFVVAAFMPLCQLRRGHASVAILTDTFGSRANLIIDLITDFLLFAVALFLAWRHLLGMLDKIKYAEVSFMLQYPIWWGYLGCLIGLVAWVLVGLYCTVKAGQSVIRGVDHQTPEQVH